jgi:hypothetical protein
MPGLVLQDVQNNQQVTWDAIAVGVSPKTSLFLQPVVLLILLQFAAAARQQPK